MVDSLVFNVPMELSLELMPLICANGVNSKRKFFNDMVYKTASVQLIMSSINLECSDTSRIVYLCILISLNGPVVFIH